MKYNDIELMDKAQKMETLKQLKKDLLSLKLMGTINGSERPSAFAKTMRKDIARLCTSLNK